MIGSNFFRSLFLWRFLEYYPVAVKETILYTNLSMLIFCTWNYMISVPGWNNTTRA